MSATDIIVRDSADNYPQKVTSEKRACSLAVTVPARELDLRKHKEAYAIAVAKTPTGAGDYFFHLANGSSDDLIIDRILLTDAGAETITLSYVTGTPGGSPTLLVPVNLYPGTTNLMATKSGVPYHDEDITGLTPVATLDAFVTGAGTLKDVDYSDRLPVVVPPGTAVALMAGTGTTAITATIHCHYAMEPVGGA